MLDSLVQSALAFVQQYPVFSSIALAMGILRIVLKPAFAILHSVVDATATSSDNDFLAKVEESTVLKGVFWVLDYLASAKIIK